MGVVSPVLQCPTAYLKVSQHCHLKVSQDCHGLVTRKNMHNTWPLPKEDIAQCVKN